MGIYIFNAKTMEEILDNDKTDFGKEIIPMSIKTKKVNSYIFSGYWEDIGTIRSFYEATLDLTTSNPQFNLFDEAKPIFSHPSNLPPCKMSQATVTESLTCEGSIIKDSMITKSVIGMRSIIESGSIIKGVILMGADFYESDEGRANNQKAGIPNIGIGRHCHIEKTIIDKNARIGDNCQINVSGKKYEDGDHGLFYSAEGIIIIRKNAVIPAGTII